MVSQHIIYIVLLIICIIEARSEKDNDHGPSLVGHYLFLLILIGFLIKSIIQEYIV